MATILIVDDTAFMRMMLKEILSNHGHQVIGEAENGEAAIEKYNWLHPDIVTMDITMPDMDGIQALKSIISRHPDASIIMCSATGQQRLVIQSVQAGAKDFIVKPFQPERVLESIERTLQKTQI